MKLSVIRERLVDTFNSVVNNNIYIDFAPSDVDEGYILDIQQIQNKYIHIEDVKPDTVELDVSVNCFSFRSRADSDRLFDALTENLNGKCNDDFLLIKCVGATNVPFDEELGAFCSGANFSIIMRGNIE